MRKVVKGLLIGGAVGAGVAGAMALNDETSTDPVGPRVAKAAARGAAVGAAFGWYLDRRDRIRLARAHRSGLAGALAGVGQAAEGALPAIQHAADLAARRAAEAAEAARPYVESAAETVRSRAGEAAEAARPYVESALQSARGRAPALAAPVLRGDERAVIVAV